VNQHRQVPSLTADEVANVKLRLMQISLVITFPCMPNALLMAHQRWKKRKRIRLHGFTLDSSSHRTGDAALHPRHAL